MEEECGEIYYGHMDKGDLYPDWSIPRRCNKPKGHKDYNHWWDRKKEIVLPPPDKRMWATVDDEPYEPLQ